MSATEKSKIRYMSKEEFLMYLQDRYPHQDWRLMLSIGIRGFYENMVEFVKTDACANIAQVDIDCAVVFLLSAEEVKFVAYNINDPIRFYEPDDPDDYIDGYIATMVSLKELSTHILS